jgi:AcrR family transcriptional regulator
VKQRLPAAERREALLETALELFAEGSYRGVTTADVAGAAGVTEPVLYRHFGSKRELFLACLDEQWRLTRAEVERVLAVGTTEQWLKQVGGGSPELRRQRGRLANLWVQALTEASEDEVVRDRLREHLAEVNRTVAGAMRRAQEAGVLAPGRDVGAEAWISMAAIFLDAAGRRLGGLLSEDDFERIGRARKAWMSGQGEA